jgi:hypothetical protein
MVDSSKTDCSSVAQALPRLEYGRRASAAQVRVDRLASRYRNLFRGRTFALVVIVALAWLAEKERLLPLLLSLPVIVFIGAVFEKNRALRAWLQALRVVRFYERRIANVSGLWAGTGEPGTRYLHEGHPYARDLDVFGQGSLFERLHVEGTPLGEQRLAAWLSSPATAEQVRARQAAVTELRDKLDLREDLALVGQMASSRASVHALEAWAIAPTSAAHVRAR